MSRQSSTISRSLRLRIVLLIQLTCLHLSSSELLSTISCSDSERSALANCGRALGQYQLPLSSIYQGGLRDFLGNVGRASKAFEQSCQLTSGFKECAARTISAGSKCRISSCFIRSCDAMVGQPNRRLFIEKNLLCLFRLMSKPRFTHCVKSTLPSNAKQLDFNRLANFVPQLVNCVEPNIFQFCGPSVENLLHLIDPSNGLCYINLQPPRRSFLPTPQFSSGGTNKLPFLAPSPTPFSKLPAGTTFGGQARIQGGQLPRVPLVQQPVLAAPPSFKPQKPSRQFSFKESIERNNPTLLTAAASASSLNGQRTTIGQRQFIASSSASLSSHQQQQQQQSSAVINDNRQGLVSHNNVAGRLPSSLPKLPIKSNKKESSLPKRISDSFGISQPGSGIPSSSSFSIPASPSSFAAVSTVKKEAKMLSESSGTRRGVHSTSPINQTPLRQSPRVVNSNSRNGFPSLPLRPTTRPPTQKPFTCTDTKGISIQRGEEYLDKDGTFFLQCPLQGKESRIIACADHNGLRYGVNQQWTTKDGFFVNKCLIGPPGPTTHKTVACIDNSNNQVTNGSDWLVGRFYQRCVLDPFNSGWSFIKVVACRDDYGNRVVNGTEWPSKEFMYYRRCALDDGDGQNRIMTVACTDENGRRIENGQSWDSLDGLYRKTCLIDADSGSGQIETTVKQIDRTADGALGCVDDLGNLVENGTEWTVSNGRFVKACRIKFGVAHIPVIGCIDDNGQRVANGSEWPSKDFLYYQRCQLDNGDGRNRIYTIACANEDGIRKFDGDRWTTGDGIKKQCKLNRLKGTAQIEVIGRVRQNPSACTLDDGRKFLNNTEWLMDNGRFFKKCVIGNGWFDTPVVACVDDLKNRVANATVFPTIDFLYFQRCELDNGEGLNRIFTIACADDEGNKIGHLNEWNDRNGLRKRCILDSNKGTGQIVIIGNAPTAPARTSLVASTKLSDTVEETGPLNSLGTFGQSIGGIATSGNSFGRDDNTDSRIITDATCIDDATGKVLNNGTEWLPKNGRFYKRCVVEDGWSYVAVIACVDDFGNKVPNGTIWPTKDLLYFQRCSLDSGDGLNRIFTVACADEKGNKQENGNEWITPNGKQRKRCNINILNGTGQIEVFPNESNSGRSINRNIKSRRRAPPILAYMSNAGRLSKND